MKVVYRKGWVKIQQMYENLEPDLDLKLLFMVTGACYESGLLYPCNFWQTSFRPIPAKSANNIETLARVRVYIIIMSNAWPWV